MENDGYDRENPRDRTPKRRITDPVKQVTIPPKL
jgi:hypothetical protein